MMHRSTFQTLGLGLALALAAGCATLPQPPRATRKLDPAESRAVESCHQAIGKLSTQFLTKALRHASRCTDRAVGLRLEEDGSFIGGDLSDVLAKRRNVRERCEGDFEKIGADSTKLIDGLIARCTPVEAILLDDVSRGDPLRFMTLNALFEALGMDELHFESVPELAAVVCGHSVHMVAELYYLTAPRISDAAEVIYNMEMDDFADYVRGFTDARCRDFDA